MSNLPTRRAAARSPLDHDPVRLRRHRVAQGRRQADVAAAAGISPGYLSELEAGSRNPSPVVLLRLAKALGCTSLDLMPEQAVDLR